MEIPQPARSIFQVRLKMEDRFSKAMVPSGSNFRQSSGKDYRFTCDQLRNNLVVQQDEQLVVTDQEPAVQQRDGELDILLIEATALVDCASSRADAQPRVPQFLTDGPHFMLSAYSKLIGLA